MPNLAFSNREVLILAKAASGNQGCGAFVRVRSGDPMVDLPRSLDSQELCGLRWRANHCNMDRFQSVIRKGGSRFSGKIVLKSKKKVEG